MLLTQLAAPLLSMRAGDYLVNLLAVLQMVAALPLRALTNLWGWRFALMDGFSLPIQSNHRIRVISADGATVSTYAGNGNPGLVDGDADAG